MLAFCFLLLLFLFLLSFGCYCCCLLVFANDFCALMNIVYYARSLYGCTLELVHHSACAVCPPFGNVLSRIGHEATADAQTWHGLESALGPSFCSSIQCDCTVLHSLSCQSLWSEHFLIAVLSSVGILVCLISPPCLESQGWHLIPLSYLLSCFFLPIVLLLFLSCHCFANGPFSCLFSRKLKYFSLRVRLFCMALVEQLGDDSW